MVQKEKEPLKEEKKMETYFDREIAKVAKEEEERLSERESIEDDETKISHKEVQLKLADTGKDSMKNSMINQLKEAYGIENNLNNENIIRKR